MPTTLTQWQGITLPTQMVPTQPQLTRGGECQVCPPMSRVGVSGIGTKIFGFARSMMNPRWRGRLPRMSSWLWWQWELVSRVWSPSQVAISFVLQLDRTCQFLSISCRESPLIAQVLIVRFTSVFPLLGWDSNRFLWWTLCNDLINPTFW